ncbi:tetratricopeptide repeat protein [Nocardiopsis sp. NPDC101807]|uniref:AfsR/SARP family transcriptional regulator n=1 Tax=Nocardiopsis sp. NPDC101807 TaxID=3364339 RepID=UPI00380AD63E
MQLNVLGEVRLSADGHQVRLGAGKERELVVHLALADGRPLSARELAERLWDDSPPASFRATLHTYVTRLRRRLEAVGIERTVLTHGDGGYLLHLPPQAVDWRRLTHARARASALRQSGQHRAARSCLEEALRLWRGVPLSGLPGRWIEHMRLSMERAHQETLAEWAALALDTGGAAEVARTLQDVLARYPLNDALHLWALRAMRATGRTTEALMAYQGLQSRLSEELGASPSHALQREFRRLLQDTSPIGAGEAPSDRGGTAAPRPDNLDRVTKSFRGRERELLLLTSRLREADANLPRTWVISGMPGIGKSTLAAHAAHLAKDGFPDATLHVDLRGNHERLPPRTPEEAITELLRLLLLPAKHIPDSSHELAALWREHTRSMRALVILDDAASAEQVAPLLPSGDRCAVIITSRSQLPRIEDVERLPLGLPSLAESVEMFSAAGGRAVQESESDVMRQVITRCGRLPLAMRLVGTLLRLHPTWTLDDMLRKLPHVGERGLSAFRVGQLDMARVFDLSLRALGPEARAAYLLLGLHPTRVVCARVATALIGGGEDASRRSLDELVDASLVEEHEPDRFRVHALIKVHAYNSALGTLPEDEVRAARARMHAAYLEGCRRADLSLYPHRQGLDSEETRAGIAPWTAEEAQTWLRNELPTVLTVIGDARAHGSGGVAAELAHVLAEHLDVHGPWHSAPELHEDALCWHLERGSARGAARAGFDLARALRRAGEVQRALRHSTAARERWAGLGDALGESWGVAQHAMLHFVSGRYEQSLSCLESALETFETRRHRPGLVFVLHFRGLCHYMTGSYHEAVADFGDVISLLERSPDRDGLLDARMNLAGALQQLGYHREAWDLCEAVLDAARSRGDDRRLTVAWTNMADLALHRHRPEQAVECLRQALASLGRFHDPWTESSALATMGTAHLMLDRYQEARGHFLRCLRLREFAPPMVAVDTLLGLASVEQAEGAPSEATRHLRHAIETATRHGLRKHRAGAHHALGQHLSSLGQGDEGRDHLRQAADLYEELAAPEAAVVRSLLEAAG